MRGSDFAHAVGVTSRTRGHGAPDFVCAVYLDGEYGIKGLFVGVPVKLGEGGAEEIIQIKLTAEENAALQKSSASVRELVNVLGL